MALLYYNGNDFIWLRIIGTDRRKTTPQQLVKAEKPINVAPGQPVASPLDTAKKSAEKAEARTKQVDQEARAMAGEANNLYRQWQNPLPQKS